MSVLLFPLLGFVINFFFLKRRSSYAGLIATVSVLGAFLSLIVSGYLHTFPHTWVVSDWISIGALNVDFSFRLDLLSYWMGVMITGVGTLIHLYAIGYMKEDDRPASFFAYMNLFVFFMLILVLSTSFLGTFVFHWLCF
jgi:NADH-quinone oxidoreductase subunit L